VITRVCSQCGIEKKITEFHRRSSVSCGVMSHCKSCNNHLSRKYRLSEDEYNKLLISQDGKCAICKSEDPGGRYTVLNVDHDHNTGEVRGLLCLRCNHVLGYVNDDIEILKTAIDYLSTRKSRKHL